MTDLKTLANSANSTELPQVYKEEDLAMMIELIMNGLWRDTNLATALHISRDTIAEWKKRPEVKDAHRRAILKYSKRRTDTDKILGELDVEIPQDAPKALVQINYQPIFGGKSLDAIPADNSNQQDISIEKEN